MVAGILLLFPAFFLEVFLPEPPAAEPDEKCFFEFLCENRRQLKEELGTLKILGSAVIGENPLLLFLRKFKFYLKC